MQVGRVERMKKATRRITSSKKKAHSDRFLYFKSKNKPQCVEKMLLLPPFAVFVCFVSILLKRKETLQLVLQKKLEMKKLLSDFN